MYILLFLILSNVELYAQDTLHSAKRAKHESYLDVASYYEKIHNKQNNFLDQEEQEEGKSAYQLKTSRENLDLSTIQEEYDSEKLQELFINLRDDRAFWDEKREQFPRRLTWLYPDDGCFIRAHLINFLLDKLQYQSLKKIFVFGNLNAKTANHPHGEVSWWYHVAPITKVGDKYLVLDPSLEHHHPVELDDWLKIFSPKYSYPGIELSLCEPVTVKPYDSNCNLTNIPSYDSSVSSLQTYLSYEWDRQIELKREPNDVLGDKPIWKNND